MAAKIEQQDFIADVRRVAEIVGHTPTCEEYKKHGKHARKVGTRIFGTGRWPRILAACGLIYQGRKRIVYHLTRATALNDIKRVAKKLGRVPTSTEYKELGSHSLNRVVTHYGGWARTLAACGLFYNKPPRRIPDAELEEDIRRVEKELNRLPLLKEYEQHGRYSRQPYLDRVPSHTWQEALVRFLGASEDEAFCAVHRSQYAIKTVDEWLARVREIAAKIGRPPTCPEANARGLNPTKLRRRMGNCTWASVLQQAGLDTKKMTRKARGYGMTDEDILQDIAMIARRLRRMPTTKEYGQAGLVSYEVALRRFGSWAEIAKRIGHDRPTRSQEMAGVDDPVRDFLKESSVDAIQQFFRKKTT